MWILAAVCFGVVCLGGLSATPMTSPPSVPAAGKAGSGSGFSAGAKQQFAGRTFGGHGDSIRVKKLPDLYWNSSNPIFRIDNTDHIMDVNLGARSAHDYDQVDLICPLYDRRATPDEADTEQYVIYAVNKEEYDTCRVMTASPRIIAQCVRPYELNRFTISFRTFSPMPGALEYKAGRDYYFISTSARGDLRRRSDGMCRSHNMRVVFKVAELSTAPPPAAAAAVVPSSTTEESGVDVTEADEANPALDGGLGAGLDSGRDKSSGGKKRQRKERKRKNKSASGSAGSSDGEGAVEAAEAGEADLPKSFDYFLHQTKDGSERAVLNDIPASAKDAPPAAPSNKKLGDVFKQEASTAGAGRGVPSVALAVATLVVLLHKATWMWSWIDVSV